MKKFSKKLLLAVIGLALAFCFFVPVSVVANAEGVGTQETVEQEEIVQKEDLTIEDLLLFVGELANESGLGDEWNSTMDQLKVALEEEKISATLVVNILILAAITFYIIIKAFSRFRGFIKKKRNPSTIAQDLQDVKKINAAQTDAVNKQTKAINALAETDSQVAKTVEKENGKLDALAEAQTGTNAALRALIRGTAIKTEYKDEALRALNKSDEQCDLAKK